MAVKPTTDPWGFEHDEFPRSDWKDEVRNGDTLRGYRDWVMAQLESEGREDEIEKADPIIVEVKDGTIHTIYNIPEWVEIRMEEFGLDDLEDFDHEESILIPGTQVHVRKFTGGNEGR